MSVLVETYQPTVLGKRKRLPQTYTFNLDSPEPTETRKPGPSRHVQSSSPTAPVKVTLEQRKKFICEWEGCGRSYSKPVRLEEHHRSHTGEVCTISCC
jgi:general transcription factor IIIA